MKATILRRCSASGKGPLKRDDFGFGSSSRSNIFLAHDLFPKAILYFTNPPLGLELPSQTSP